MLKQFFQSILKRKFLAFIFLLLIIGGGYFVYKKIYGNSANETRYVLTRVEKGVIITSVSGSGQVSALDQVDIKPKVSSDVTSIAVEQGSEVRQGAMLVRLDSVDAQKAVQDAKTNLETANLEFEKLISPPDELTLLQAEDSLTQAKAAKQKAESNIIKGYENAFNTTESVFFNVPTIMTNIQSILYDDTVNVNQDNVDAYQNYIKPSDGNQILPFITSAESDYNAAKVKYIPNLANYKNTSRYAAQSVIESLLSETLETTKAIAQAIKSEKNLIDFVIDYVSELNIRIPSTITTYQSNLQTYLSQANGYYSSLLTVQQTIQDNVDAKVSAETSIKQKELSLAELKAGADELDIRAKKIVIQQKEDALLIAQQNLADYFIYAPFGGIITKVNVKNGDSVSSGTALASLITQQKIAEIALNEIDAAKVKVGQKATITFDAIEDLSLTGLVIEMDSIGTVSQGVVTYNVIIAFDTQDEMVKPGMSVSATIITDVKQDVLLVSNSAVKSTNGNYYVQILDGVIDQATATTTGVASKVLPRSQAVQTGVVNDTSTEITDGLKEGDLIVTRTITGASSSTSTQTQQSQGGSLFRVPGVGGGR